jgi:DNA-binding SARP family transcriptional activator
MQYRLLGPLEVLDGDRVVAIGEGKRQALLALLLIHANELVSAERLIDELWGETPPPTAAKSLQVLVSQLRKALGGLEGGPLLTRANGYVLRVGEDELDSRTFERAIDEGRRRLAAGDARRAAGELTAALGLWRGPPLSGLEYEPFVQHEIARLEELRLVAIELRTEAALALGEHARVVGELEGLVRSHPLRERFRAQLMLALYRSGRQAEALAAYRDAQRELSAELGLEPGEELKRLERAILQQSPDLELAAESPARAPSTRATPPERCLLVVPSTPEALAPLLALAEPLASSSPPREIVIASVVESSELGAATAALAARRDELIGRGLAVRTAAFSSPTPGEDLVRMASDEDADLMIVNAGGAPLEGETGVLLERASCDVALLIDAGGPLRAGPVVVPFGAAWHDWAALELGAWVAHATGAPLRLIGAAADGRADRRDASRLLADASLLVQRRAGVVAEPLLGSPGRRGVMALAEGAGLLVVGLSERWRDEGLGRVRSALVTAPPAPTVLVRRGQRADALAPASERTRFGWSLTADSP